MQLAKGYNHSQFKEQAKSKATSYIKESKQKRVNSVCVITLSASR